MPLDPKALMSLPIPARKVAYDGRDSLLYALAAGMGGSASAADLPFVWEREQRVLPSMATILAFDDSWLASRGIDLRDVVHGALDLRFHAPLTPSGEATCDTRVIGLDDKGAGRPGLVFAETTVAQGDARACIVLSTLFVRGGGGFGGATGIMPDRAPIPSTEPQRETRLATAVNQAMLFRLLGDRNPLHIDPELAVQVGFARPILHGACTFAIACAETLRAFCDHDPLRLRRFAARFAGPLYPGETLAFAFWREGDRVAFRAGAVERDAPVLDNGLAELGV